jgi:hypothetical protein
MTELIRPRSRTRIELPLAEWSLEAEAGPEGAQEITLPLGALFDWRDDPQLKFARGPATSTNTLTISDGDVADGDTVELDLGWVQGTADVSVNSDPVDMLVAHPFRTDITDSIQVGENLIEVTVTPPLRNWFVGLGERDDPRYENRADTSDTLIAAGLLGPARVLIS